VVVTTDDNLTFTGRGHGLEKGEEVDLAIRPESIRFLTPGETITLPHGPNLYEAEVVRASYVGELIDYQLRIKNHLIRAKGEVQNPHGVSERVLIKLDPDQLAVLCR
jgi:ABC-type Fe3+/spermidine/putrescine transport system ATPase subunit